MIGTLAAVIFFAAFSSSFRLEFKSLAILGIPNVVAIEMHAS
jgi:hypothetical protein